VAAGVLAAGALIGLLAGCSTTTDGTATRSSGTLTPIEPDFPTPRPTRSSPTPPPSPPPPSSRIASPPAPGGGEELQPQNGYVFIETKSGKTRCQLDTTEVACESQFTDSPEVEGEPANGVRVTSDGQVSWVLGNLGAIPAVTLDYRTYTAPGWTIEASEDGTRFTNDTTGHGMVVRIEGVESF
jgi:hypothetical protein